jgi:hypothetical protein
MSKPMAGGHRCAGAALEACGAERISFTNAAHECNDPDVVAATKEKPRVSSMSGTQRTIQRLN